MTPTEYESSSQPAYPSFNQSRRGSQQSNYHNNYINQTVSSSPSSSRWKGFLPSWSRRGSQSKAGGATEEEVLAAMKEANRERRRSLMLTGEEDVENREKGGSGPHWNYGGDGFVILGDNAEYDSINLNYGNIESAFQFASFHRGISQSNRSSARYSHHHHQQQDSVSSMQQFYHIPQYGNDEHEGPQRYYSSEYNYEQRIHQIVEHATTTGATTLSTVMETTDRDAGNDQGDNDRTPFSRPLEHAIESQGQSIKSNSSQNQNQTNCQNHRMPVIEHKAITKLTSQQQQQPRHTYSESSASNSTLSSTESSSPTVLFHSRSAIEITHPSPVAATPRRHHHSPPPSLPHSSTVSRIPSPPSPVATSDCTRHSSSSSSMTLKLKALDNIAMSTVMMASERQLRGQNMYDISIDMTGNNGRNVNGGGDDDGDAFSPPSPESCMSQSTTSATLVALTISAANSASTDTVKSSNSNTIMQESGTFENEEEYNAPLFMCWLPDWETFKSGLLPTSKHAREALLATIILAFVTIGLETILLQRHRSMTTSLTQSAGPYEISFFRPLTVYYLIFILAEVFAVGLLWDAAIHKNSLQLVAFTIFEWCMVSYSGLQIWQHDQLFKGIGVPMDVMIELGDSNTRMILFSQLGVQVTACLGITLLTWRLYSEFGWLVFQKLGADVSLRKMMKEYRLLFTLLKLDAFFFFGYAIQVAALTDKQWQKGLIEVAFAIPLSAIIILLGFCALRNENKVTMGGFITCLTLLIGYMIFRLSALYQTLTGDPSSDPYFFSRRTMTVFAALTLFITILAFINAIVMLYNFNKGLKEAMRQYRVRRSGTIRSVTPSLNRISVNGSGSISGEILGPGSRPVSGGVAGNKGTGRNSKRTSKRSLLHRDMSSSTPVMAERWQIE